MSRPEKFLTASAKELLAWYSLGDGRGLTAQQALTAVRDEVAREVREEEQTRARANEGVMLRALDDLKARAERAERERDSARRILDAVAEALGFAKTYDASMLPSAAADAKRQGAWEALTKCSEHLGKGNSQPVYVGGKALFAYERVREFRNTHYAPSAPAGVKLGEWVVTYDVTNGRCPWEVRHVDGKIPSAFETLVELLFTRSLAPTADEYAALLRLADRGDKGNA